MKLPVLISTFMVISGCASKPGASKHGADAARTDAAAKTDAAQPVLLTGAAAKTDAGVSPDAAQPVLLDVLVVARHAYSKHSPNPTHDVQNKAQADLIASQLKVLPAAIAASDYQIALAGNIGSNCIQPVITASSQFVITAASQPDPGTALATAFRNLDSSPWGEGSGPGHGIPGGTGALRALNNVMTALTDIHATGLSWEFQGDLPQEGSHTDNLGRVRARIALQDGTVEGRIDGKPFVRYRKLQNGLVVLDYYDNFNKERTDIKRQVTCGRSWLREGSIVAIVVIDVMPSHWRYFDLCRGSLCSMPDIEEALRDLGRIDSTTSPLQRRYRLYGLTDKNGRLYNNPFTTPSQRPPLAELLATLKSTTLTVPEKINTLSLRVDWQDFEQYTISNSKVSLVDYLGSVNDEQDYAHIFADIVAAITPSE